jgi:hypothetical protein
VLLALTMVAASVAPAFAQRTTPAFGTGRDGVPQTFNLTFGTFVPHGADARVDDDVLNVNRTFLSFDLDEFKGGSVGAEWLFPIGRHVEAGAGLSFSRRTVASVYTDFIDSDGTEIDQDLRLRLVPIALTVRVLPFGQDSPVQPYVGGGISIVNWRYSEFGEFIDFSQGMAIFQDSFTGSGTTTGPIVLGGLRFAGDRFGIGGEVRYQKGEAPLSNDFAGSKLDLGGWTYQATIGFRF